jgi:hypothetical protein
MPTENDKTGETCLELNCAAYQIAAAAVSYGPAGDSSYTFRCAPVSAADRRRLRRAVVAKTPVRLVFRDSQILLGDVKVDEGSDQWVGIEGRILVATTTERNTSGEGVDKRG